MSLILHRHEQGLGELLGVPDGVDVAGRLNRLMAEEVRAL